MTEVALSMTVKPQLSRTLPRMGEVRAIPRSAKARIMVVPVPRYCSGKVSAPSDTTQVNSSAWPKPIHSAGPRTFHSVLTTIYHAWPIACPVSPTRIIARRPQVRLQVRVNNRTEKAATAYPVKK